MPEWYDVVTGDELEQGDLLPGMKIYVPGEPEGNEPAGTHDGDEDVVVPLTEITVNTVVLTQTCDLVQASNVNEVLLAKVVAYDDLVQEEKDRGKRDFYKSTKFREQAIGGNLPGVSLLRSHTHDPQLRWSVVTFHQLYIVPLDQARRAADECGPRLRLVSPYKEHLAQAFARYFMRVGLPHDAHDFKEQGKAMLPG